MLNEEYEGDVRPAHERTVLLELTKVPGGPGPGEVDKIMIAGTTVIGMGEVRRRWVDSDGVRLAVSEQGTPDGLTIVLVHGYPDNSSVWDGVAARLGERFRVVRHDVRGHGESSAPSGRTGYRMEYLVKDLVAVIGATSPATPVHLVGHDWGAMQSWPMVSDPRHAGLVASFTSISGPSLDQTAAWMRRSARSSQVANQLARSWYIAGFQLPVLPELVWRIEPLRRRFHADYRDARNGLELYRMNMAGRVRRSAPRAVPVPVLQIALTRDRYCLPDLLAGADPWCARLWRRELAAGHWAIRDQPDVIAHYVTDFVCHLDGGQASPELDRARITAH